MYPFFPVLCKSQNPPHGKEHIIRHPGLLKRRPSLGFFHPAPLRSHCTRDICAKNTTGLRDLQGAQSQAAAKAFCPVPMTLKGF